MSTARRPYLRRRAGRAQVAARLRLEYEQGLSVAVLVERHGFSRSVVQRLLHEAGTRMRVPPPRPPALRPVTGEADLDALVDQWLSGRG